jgi:hypothetical protein
MSAMLGQIKGVSIAPCPTPVNAQNRRFSARTLAGYLPFRTESSGKYVLPAQQGPYRVTQPADPSVAAHTLQDDHGGRYNKAMGTVKEIVEAVQRLQPSELAAFRAWFAEFDGELWDHEMEADVAAGRLDHLAEEALRDLREGRCTDL